MPAICTPPPPNNGRAKKKMLSFSFEWPRQMVALLYYVLKKLSDFPIVIIQLENNQIVTIQELN